jgi:hypothetical protein
VKNAIKLVNVIRIRFISLVLYLLDVPEIMVRFPE